MADEAVLRIVLSDAGGATAGTAPIPGSAPSSTQAPAPQQQTAPTSALSDAERRQLIKDFGPKQAAEIERLMGGQQGPQQQTAPPVPASKAFDPVEVAKKRVDREKQWALAEAEYAKLKPPTTVPPFDPAAEARKRREGQQRAAQVDAAYKQQYGDPGKETGLDSIIKIVDQLRGTIGGVFGTVVGGVLDIVSGIRKAQVETADKKNRGSLLKGIGGKTETTEAAEGAEVAGAEAGGAEAAEAGGAMAGLEAATGPIGIAIGAFVAAVEVFKAATNQIDQAAQKYGQYSPEIARAQAQADVRNTLGNLKRSQEIGSEMVYYIKAQTDLQQTWEDTKVMLLKQIIPSVTIALQMLKDILRVADSFMSIWKEDKTPVVKSPTEQLFMHEFDKEGGAWVP